jgi:hypothetical protein
MSSSLEMRLKEYGSKRWKRSEELKIINEFVLSPLLATMIESLNKVHKVQLCEDDKGVSRLKFQCEVSKKSGFWNMIGRWFCPYETCLVVYKDSHIFICEYYKHGFFEVSDRIKHEYDDKLKSMFNSEFVVLCRA